MSELTLHVRRHEECASDWYTFFEDDPYGQMSVDLALDDMFNKTILTPELLREAADILEQHLKEEK